MNNSDRNGYTGWVEFRHRLEVIRTKPKAGLSTYPCTNLQLQLLLILLGLIHTFHIWVSATVSAYLHGHLHAAWEFVSRPTAVTVHQLWQSHYPLTTYIVGMLMFISPSFTFVNQLHILYVFHTGRLHVVDFAVKSCYYVLCWTCVEHVCVHIKGFAHIPRIRINEKVYGKYELAFTVE